jgi:hypothetical protein
MNPQNGRTWAAWILPLALTFAGCGDSDPASPNQPIDTTPPSVPAAVELFARHDFLEVTWAPNAEADLAGYVVARSLDDGVTWTQVAEAPLTENTFEDGKYPLVQYRVAAVDVASNQSAYSSAVGYRVPNDRPKFPEDLQSPNN